MADTPKRHRINWLAVRTYYIEGHTATECAAKFKVARETVSRKASEEKWEEQRHKNITDAQNLLDAADTRDKADALAEHANLADDLIGEVRQALKDIANARDSKGKPLSARAKAETLKVLAETADKAVRLSRDVRGIRQGESSVSSTNDGDAYEYEWVEAPRPVEAQA